MKYNFTRFLSMYSCWLLLLVCIGGTNSLKAQTGQRLSGLVIDSVDKVPIPNVSISIKGTKQGTTTDVNGKFTLDISGEGTTLIFSYVSYKSQEVYVQKGKPVTIRMTSSQDQLEEVAIVAYGTQKKSSMVASITTVNPKELKGPTSNLTTMLAGRIAGMVAYQRSGEPGMDNASFFIRGVGSFGAGKKDPLILIDGMESTGTDLARLQPDDISGFSVLKDAAASSLYGARGANGVVLVTTKQGDIGAAKFNVRFENSVSSNTKNFKFADNITYMNLANEAVLTRDPNKTLPYFQNKIDHTAAGDNPLLYPNNNWIKQLIKDYTNNQRFNMNVSGGGNTASYYVAGTYNVDNGVLRTEKNNNIDNNIKIKNYAVRS
jgi:TonB-linked SusC/RagA family outer membrane protein